MRLGLTKQWLLILTLLVGQWFLVAHTHSHPALDLDQVCEVCVHAAGLDSGALAGKPAALSLSATQEAPSSAIQWVAIPSSIQLPNIRGPPARLA